MSALDPESTAPPITGVDFAAGPTVVFFYKVTCPVCQMAAPKVGEFERAYPGRIVGVGQDPEDKLADFDRELEMGFESVADLPPYELSNAYQIGVVPTLFLVRRRRSGVHRVVEPGRVQPGLEASRGVDGGGIRSHLRAERRATLVPAGLRVAQLALVQRVGDRMVAASPTRL